jgi:murein DD-endopeptidase MepM/ murein hydrolase activator NlpD
MAQEMKDFSPRHRRIDLSRNDRNNPWRRLAFLALFFGFILSFSGSVIWFNDFTSPSLSLSSPVETGIISEQKSENDSLLADKKDQEPVFTEDEVKIGDTFETVLERNGIDRAAIPAMINAARPLHNLNRVVTGRSFKFTFADNSLEKLEYEIDEDRSLVLEARDSSDWKAGLEETVYQETERELCGTIESSLYQTVVDISGMPELALKLSEIYAWQIDFHNDIRKGDTFKLIYEEKVHPKGMKKVDRIIAAVFRNGDKDYWAIRFANKDNRIDYFDTDGNSLRRKFLKSPFKYMPRISSRFSLRRFHPILKIYRPHLGVDYATPSGTPVLSLGDGRVTYYGWNGGFGRFIMIKHNGMYATSYGHLSGYSRNLHTGSQVTQGQVIGYVGRTGLATGPHLDFRFYKNNHAVNPLTVDIPAGDPVHKSIFSAYVAYRDSMKERLEKMKPVEIPILVIEPSNTPYGPPLFSIAANGSARDETE